MRAELDSCDRRGCPEVQRTHSLFLRNLEALFLITVEPLHLVSLGIGDDPVLLCHDHLLSGSGSSCLRYLILSFCLSPISFLSFSTSCWLLSSSWSLLPDSFSLIRVEWKNRLGIYRYRVMVNNLGSTISRR